MGVAWWHRACETSWQEDTMFHAAPQSQIHSRPQPRSDVRAGIESLRPELFARALRLSRSRARAEDIVQDTMLRALRFEDQFKSGTNLRAWVCQVLMSVFLTECRKSKRERRALDNLTRDPCAWTQSDAPVAMRALSASPTQALAALPESYRRAVELVDLQDLSYREAADRLGVPVGTIMSRLHRGRKLLANALAPATELAPAEPAESSPALAA
jgi:RNA polymerase sigma-70 factor (ECF subfamily)